MSKRTVNKLYCSKFGYFSFFHFQPKCLSGVVFLPSCAGLVSREDTEQLLPVGYQPASGPCLSSSGMVPTSLRTLPQLFGYSANSLRALPQLFRYGTTQPPDPSGMVPPSLRTLPQLFRYGANQPPGPASTLQVWYHPASGPFRYGATQPSDPASALKVWCEPASGPCLSSSGIVPILPTSLWTLLQLLRCGANQPPDPASALQV
jgi:hypothetical protein